MDTSWLEILSNVDKMVLGSIVGSVLLAFVLLVVIFSIKIKMLHDQIRDHQTILELRDQELQRKKEALIESQRQLSDTEAIMEHFQKREEALLAEVVSIRKKWEVSQETATMLRIVQEQISQEKEELESRSVRLQNDLVKANEEIQAVLKRNEFWVHQLSELRTRHDELKLKLRTLPSMHT